MKRSLLESVRVAPYVIGQPIDRIGALSAVLGINVSSADEGAAAVITVTHSDTDDGTYTAVEDKRIFLNATVPEYDGGGNFVKSIVSVPVESAQLVNVDIDIVGCKQFVKIGVEYVADDGESADVTATYALCLGDFSDNPPV